MGKKIPVTFVGGSEILPHKSNPSGTLYVFHRGTPVLIPKEDAEHYRAEAEKGSPWIVGDKKAKELPDIVDADDIKRGLENLTVGELKAIAKKMDIPTVQPRAGLIETLRAIIDEAGEDVEDLIKKIKEDR